MSPKIVAKSAKLVAKSSMLSQNGTRDFFVPYIYAAVYVAVYGLWSMVLQRKFSQNDLPN
jgi:hypothetical protein